jgi:hypothetical protein
LLGHHPCLAPENSASTQLSLSWKAAQLGGGGVLGWTKLGFPRVFLFPPLRNKLEVHLHEVVNQESLWEETEEILGPIK